MKRVDTAYAAKKLGVSQTSVRNLVRRGELTDHGTTRDGGKRHQLVLDKDQVIQFANTHVWAGRSFLPVSDKAAVRKIRRAQAEPLHTVQAKQSVQSVQSSAKGEFAQRLERIEESLALLVKNWG